LCLYAVGFSEPSMFGCLIVVMFWSSRTLWFSTTHGRKIHLEVTLPSLSFFQVGLFKRFLFPSVVCIHFLYHSVYMLSPSYPRFPCPDSIRRPVDISMNHYMVCNILCSSSTSSFLGPHMVLASLFRDSCN
jgi:hypothetical protein